MSKSKILSREEKRARLLSMFHEGQEFYQNKELEKMAKEKGLNQNQIKDILQMLVDDGVVDSDKIGSMLFYWSFPNKACKIKQKQAEELKASRKTLDHKLVTLEAALKSEQETQNDSDKLKRDRLLNEIRSFRVREKDLLDFVKQNEAMDPEKAVKLKSDIKQLHEAANRWTDNVFQIKNWCTRNFNFEDAALNKQFGIPGNFDYLE